MKKIKVSFIGSGAMAREHLKAFQNIAEVELSGIYSRTIEKSEALAKDFSLRIVTRTISELYDKTKADIVVIAVSELSAREVCLEAFNFPWKVLIEKPAGYNIADAQIILNAAKENKRDVFVALNRRHYGSTRTLKNNLYLEDGPRLIHLTDQEDLFAAKNAGKPDLVVQNWMYANSIHLIDFFSFLARGSLISVTPILSWNAEVPSYVIAKLTFSSGDIGIYEAVWNRPGPWSAVVTTDDKRWEMRPLEQITCQTYPSRKTDLLPTEPWDSSFKPGVRFQAEESIKAVRGQKHALPTLAEAFVSMQLVQQIYSK